jgi:hypothetical protein
MPRRKRRNSRKTKQPIAVTVIASGIVVLFLIRLYQVIAPLVRAGVFLGGIRAPLFEDWRLTGLGSALLSSAVYLLLSIAGIVVLIGFLRLRPWAWVLLMAWTGISLSISLVEYFYRHAPNYAVMAANAVIAFALNTGDVRRIFGIGRNENESAA